MRKLATAAAVSLALASGGAFGLGLGEIEMQSALNQPMSAEIALTSVQPGELEGMIVQLAPAAAYERAGIERSSVLLDLKFSIDESSGSPVIKVESTRPVVEPFLNFLLEVDWPQGRMVREYTVLLDPPVFMSPSASERNAAADQPAVVQSGETALVVPTPIDRSADSLEDGLDVGLGDLEDAGGESVLSLDEATAPLPLGDDGELVSLDGLSDDSLLSDGSEGAEIEGNEVSLSDLGAPNTDAQAQRDADALEAFDIDDFEVELVGGTAETSDDVANGEDGQPVVDTLSDDGSTIVSLDDIEEPAQNTASNTEVAVNSGDTLFEIARDNAPAGTSVQQMMMAILAANESAFINNNINLVRAGAILRVPEIEDDSVLTQAEALAAISDQNQLWQDYRDSLRGTAATQVAQNIEPDAGSNTDLQQTPDTIEAASLAVDEAADGLSDEARAILENARQEILEREELRIVADNLPSDTTASATADETTDSDSAARIGEVNRRLQLAREELSATRLRTSDLSDQAGELQSTTSNLDAMVSLRQNEVARLEAQLSDAREAAESAAQDATDATADTMADAANVVTDAAGEATEEAGTAVDEAGNTVDGLTDPAADTVADADDAAQAGADELATAADDVLASADNTTEEAMDSGTNALTEAGETLGEVELFSPDDAENISATDAQIDEQAAAATAVGDASNETRSWYQDFLDDPKRMAIAGIGGLGLLGVLGTLFFRRKRREDDSDDAMLDAIDQAEFADHSPAAPDLTAASAGGRLDNSAAFAAAGAAGVAGAASGAFGNEVDNATDRFDNASGDDVEHEHEHDTTIALGASPVDPLQGLNESHQVDAIDKDDTISEVDVYLAYGLHGQAEELLTKAIERKPENQDYAGKLLQTYHAQGNGDAFHHAASDFHQRFGGDSNPEWPGIASMGSELRPNDPLYASSVGAVGRVSSDGSETMGEEDFFSSQSSDDAGSVSRDFAQHAEAVDFIDEDESPIMDESIDPAFAFDEGDLEATGDFSTVAEELTAENDDGSIDFPNFEQSGSAANQNLEEELSLASDGTMSLDDLDGLTESVDDLTLDLDQLSGDLELDSAELLSADLSDLDIPDLTSENELLLDSTGAFGDGTDEMDTMMDLAKAYIDMGDKDSASSALGEIVKSGSPEQVTEAETLLRNIS